MCCGGLCSDTIAEDSWTLNFSDFQQFSLLSFVCQFMAAGHLNNLSSKWTFPKISWHFFILVKEILLRCGCFVMIIIIVHTILKVVLLSVVVYSKYLQWFFLLYNFVFPILSFMQHVNTVFMWTCWRGAAWWLHFICCAVLYLSVSVHD